MVKMSIDINDTKSVRYSDEDEEHQHAVSVQKSHWRGDIIDPDVSCDVLLEIFVTLLQGMGYHKTSILRSMQDIMDEEGYEHEEPESSD